MPSLGALRLLTPLVLLSPLLAQAQADPWLTHAWHVSCSDGAAVATPEMCDDESAVSTAAYVRGQLEDLGPWLEGMGFEGPFVRIVGAGSGMRWAAEIGGDTLSLGSSTVCGYYDKSADGGRLVVDTDHSVQIEGEADATGTAAHEAFHAVQGSYAYFNTAGDAYDWITEGTAQAVEAAWMGHDQGLDVLGAGGHAYVYGPRHYDHALAEPAGASQRYATGHFWLALGQELGAPARVGYLAAMLAGLDGQGNGLAGVDAALRADGGLYSLYPRVMARFARAERHYDAPGAFRLGAGGELVRPAVEVRGLATRRVALDVHDVGADGVMLEVQIPDEPDLHLIVDGKRYSVGQDGEGERRNRARLPVRQPREVVVQVANVSRDAAASRERAVRFEARTTPLAGCRPAADGLGIAVCLSIVGPTLGGDYRLELPVPRRSSVMALGPQVAIAGRRGSRARLMGSSFVDPALYGGVPPRLDLTAVDEGTGETLKVGLSLDPDAAFVSLSGGPFGPALTHGSGDATLTVTAHEPGERFEARFTAAIGGDCRRVTQPDRSVREIGCVRHMGTNDLVPAHEVRGTLVIALPSE